MDDLTIDWDSYGGWNMKTTMWQTQRQKPSHKATMGEQHLCWGGLCAKMGDRNIQVIGSLAVRGQRRFFETSKSRLSDIEDLKKLNHMRERGPTKPSKSLRHRLGHFCWGGRPSICQVNGTRPQTLGTWRLGARNIWK